jgi:hypothetical protein
MQLRYLQTLNGIATEQNSTIVFPLPIDIFSFFQNNQLNSDASLFKPRTKVGHDNIPAKELTISPPPTTTDM